MRDGEPLALQLFSIEGLSGHESPRLECGALPDEVQSEDAVIAVGRFGWHGAQAGEVLTPWGPSVCRAHSDRAFRRDDVPYSLHECGPAQPARRRWGPGCGARRVGYASGPHSARTGLSGPRS